MRLVVPLLAVLMFAMPAAARECRLPLVIGNTHIPSSFLFCLLDEISDLKRDQARLRRAVETLEDELAAAREELKDLPGAFRNVDGVITLNENRTLAVASFVLTPRGSGMSALAIDRSAMETLCAGTGSCTLTLLQRSEGLRPSDSVETVAIGPCLFDYDPLTGAWLRGGCGTAGSLAGTDGNGTPSGSDGSETIAEAGACLLADSDPGLNVGPGTGPLGRDHARGLFLIAAPTQRQAGEGRFRCELKIE